MIEKPDVDTQVYHLTLGPGWVTRNDLPDPYIVYVQFTTGAKRPRQIPWAELERPNIHDPLAEALGALGARPEKDTNESPALRRRSLDLWDIAQATDHLASPELSQKLATAVATGFGVPPLSEWADVVAKQIIAAINDDERRDKESLQNVGRLAVEAIKRGYPTTRWPSELVFATMKHIEEYG